MQQRAPHIRLAIVLVGLAIAGFLTPVASQAMSDSASHLAWFLDLLAHWQWLYLAILVLGILQLLRRHWRYAALAVFATLPWVTSSQPAAVAKADDARAARLLNVATANLSMSDDPESSIATWLNDSSADIAVLIELSPQLAATLGHKSEYPHQALYPAQSPFGIGVVSRHPMSGVRLFRDADGIPTVEADIEWHGGQVRLVAFHPMPPVAPAYHASRNALLRDLLARMPHGQPALIVGDFNASPWSSAFDILSEGGFRRATGLAPTWPSVFRGLFGIPIDHILVSDDWQAVDATRHLPVSSDHMPVVVTLLRGSGLSE